MDLKVTPLDFFLSRSHPVSGFLESLVRALPVLFRDVEIKVKLRGRDSCLLKPISIDWAQVCGSEELSTPMGCWEVCPLPNRCVTLLELS